MPPLAEDFPIVLLEPRCFEVLLKLLVAMLKFVTLNKLSDDVLFVNDNFSVVSSRGKLLGELRAAWWIVVVGMVVETIIAEVC